MGPASSTPISAFTRHNALAHVHVIWLLKPTPLLPNTTTFSVVQLSGNTLSDAARASVSVRVVLPRLLFKKAYAALESESRVAGMRSTDEAENSELAVQLSSGNCDSVYVFPTMRDQIGSVLAFNEAIESSHRLVL